MRLSRLTSERRLSNAANGSGHGVSAIRIRAREVAGDAGAIDHHRAQDRARRRAGESRHLGGELGAAVSFGWPRRVGLAQHARRRGAALRPHRRYEHEPAHAGLGAGGGELRRCVANDAIIEPRDRGRGRRGRCRRGARQRRRPRAAAPNRRHRGSRARRRPLRPAEAPRLPAGASPRAPRGPLAPSAATSALPTKPEAPVTRMRSLTAASARRSQAATRRASHPAQG